MDEALSEKRTVSRHHHLWSGVFTTQFRINTINRNLIITHIVFLITNYSLLKTSYIFVDEDFESDGVFAIYESYICRALERSTRFNANNSFLYCRFHDAFWHLKARSCDLVTNFGIVFRKINDEVTNKFSCLSVGLTENGNLSGFPTPSIHASCGRSD